MQHSTHKPLPFGSLCSHAACLLDVCCTSGLVLAGKEAGRVLAQPLGQLGQFLAQPVDRLLIHVGLRDKFGHVDCEREERSELSKKQNARGDRGENRDSTYQTTDTNAPRHRHLQLLYLPTHQRRVPTVAGFRKTAHAQSGRAECVRGIFQNTPSHLTQPLQASPPQQIPGGAYPFLRQNTWSGSR